MRTAIEAPSRITQEAGKRLLTPSVHLKPRRPGTRRHQHSKFILRGLHHHGTLPADAA